jgi:hypothetical protein
MGFFVRMSAMEQRRRDTPRLRTILLALLGVLVVAGAIWGPKIWESREYRQVRAINEENRVWRILPGRVVERRSRIDPGISAPELKKRLGAPSLLRQSGKESASPALWTYVYADGSLDISVRDGYVQQIATTVGPRREIGYMPGMRESRAGSR